MGETAAEEPDEFWYNLRTKSVERGKQSAAIYRVGPFSTEDEAANAITLLKQRADAWREQENESD